MVFSSRGFYPRCPNCASLGVVPPPILQEESVVIMRVEVRKLVCRRCPWIIDLGSLSDDELVGLCVGVRAGGSV